MKKKFVLALWLAAMTTPSQSETVEGTAWQRGRDYIIGAARYGTIYRNQTGPYHDPDNVNLADTRARRTRRFSHPERISLEAKYTVLSRQPCAKAKPPKDK